MDIATVERLIRMLEGTHIQELVIEKNGSLISIKRPFTRMPALSAIPEEAAPELFPGPESPALAPEIGVRASLVGIFHALRPPVSEGDRVRAGETLGLIESMKLMNDIISAEDGVVVEVLVEEGQPVEYGQPLFRLRPSEGGREE